LADSSAILEGNVRAGLGFSDLFAPAWTENGKRFLSPKRATARESDDDQIKPPPHGLRLNCQAERATQTRYAKSDEKQMSYNIKTCLSTVLRASCLPAPPPLARGASPHHRILAFAVTIVEERGEHHGQGRHRRRGVGEQLGVGRRNQMKRHVSKYFRGSNFKINVHRTTRACAPLTRGMMMERQPRLIMSLEDTAMKLTAPAGGCVMPRRPSSAMATAGESACATHRGIPGPLSSFSAQ
jgi:hypothetical protein